MTEEVSKELFAKAEMALDCGQVMDGVDPRDILRLRPPTGSYASFEDWFHELEGFSLRSERAEGDIAWLRAAFDAGRSPTEARGEVVKALEWKKVGYTQVAETAACAYTIQPVSDDLGPHWEATVANRGMAWSSRDTESEIKEAVQADYEKRILSALSHPPAREAVDDAAWADRVKLLAAWLMKRAEPNSGIDYEAGDFNWESLRNNRRSRVTLYGSDADFICENFHGAGAKAMAEALFAALQVKP